jgi:hypothetical protein
VKQRKALEQARADEAVTLLAEQAATALLEKSHAAAAATTRAEQVAEVERYLALRLSDTSALSVAIMEFASAFRAMAEHTAQAVAVGIAMPKGGYLDFSELFRLVERELFRAGGDASLSGKSSIPGARAHDFRMSHQPEATTPLVDTIGEANDHVIQTLKKGESR